MNDSYQPCEEEDDNLIVANIENASMCSKLEEQLSEGE